MLLVGRDRWDRAAMLLHCSAERWTKVALLGGTTAALLGGRGDDDGLLDGRRLYCWVGEVDDGCREGSSARWEKAVLLVGRDVVAAALPGGKTTALLGGRRLRCWVGEIDDGC